ncbi:MAG: tRNA (adenosine(37)-N6)-threonylcarbamoyltransferase complex ATPase subunit type 1 TsaE, partial [Candidatus Omnitrophica bacterium]|nr:tRNA (adenosine(37)-N6)-threonylcarbamoyltransferase complex ATPase subunit type 1 TsaE [Candidatus Omnitrophota bacterium]
LGSGKTTLIKGIAEGLNIDPKKVNSPTFVLMNIYQGRLPLFHFDLYRLEDLYGIRSIGYDEFLYGDGISVIEWADRLGEFLPEEYLKIEMEHKKLDERVIRLSARNRDCHYESFMH